MSHISDRSFSYRNPLSLPERMVERLSLTARADFESLLRASSYLSNVVIFTEGEPATGIYVVLEGEVPVSIGSADADSWRQQVRLTRSVELLVGGSSIKQVAFSVGYSQPSAFVGAFRRVFGVTPKIWTERVREM